MEQKLLDEVAPDKPAGSGDQNLPIVPEISRCFWRGYHVS
jgi:hypothetical protein